MAGKKCFLTGFNPSGFEPRPVPVFSHSHPAEERPKRQTEKEGTSDGAVKAKRAIETQGKTLTLP